MLGTRSTWTVKLTFLFFVLASDEGASYSLLLGLYDVFHHCKSCKPPIQVRETALILYP